jgi:hypothetical protein
MLPGDLLAALLRTAQAPLPDRERRGNIDPQTIAEFLAFDIPFEVPSALGFHFPAGVDDA